MQLHKIIRRQLLKGYWLYVLAVALLPFLHSCKKEFSFEGAPPVILVDPPPALPPFLAPCYLCTNAAKDSSWSFTVQGSKLCGGVDDAIIPLERTSFTFFGPSTCSLDSGLVMSVYLDAPLASDKTNVTARYVAFYYYDRVAPSYALISKSGSRFSLVIESYKQATGRATGRFDGTVFKENGEVLSVENGKFNIQF